MYRLYTLAVVFIVLFVAVQAQDLRYRSPAVPPQVHYTIDCTINVTGNMLAGKETLRFTNTSSIPIERIAFEWEYVPAQTMKVLFGGKPLVQMATGVFQFPSSVAPRSEVELQVEFSRTLQDVPRSVLEERISAEVNKITLTNWHPRLSWGFPTHDMFDVKVSVPAEYIVGSSGRFDAKTGHYRVEKARSFGLFLAKGLKVAEAMAGDVQVRCFYTAKGEQAKELILATAVDAVNFYQGLFGFYPTASMTIVPGFDFPAGGYPIATALAAVHGQERFTERPLIHWQWITAHEIGHMYWGEYILEKEYPLNWLTIGLGIYTDREFIRSKRLSMEKYQEVMTRYTNGVQKLLDTTVELTPEQIDALSLDYNNVVVHGKGYAIISALATVVGKDIFENTLRQTLREYGGKLLNALSFQALCESASGQDLKWFFDQWLRSNRYLSYEVVSQHSVQRGTAYTSTVTVKRNGTLSMPIPVEALFRDGSRQLVSTDRMLDLNTLVFESASPLVSVKLDPQEELPLVPLLPEKPLTSLTDISAAIDRLPWKNAGEEARTIFLKAKELQFSDWSMWSSFGLKLFAGRHYEEALEAFQKVSAGATQGATWEFGSLVWQGHAFDMLGRRNEAQQAYRAALEKDTGKSLNHGQFGMIVNRAWVEKRLVSPFTY